MKFIDEVHITVESGHGGPGKVSFRREKFVPRGGPDGGNGGRGGHVIFKASLHLNSLLGLKFKKHHKAKNGEPGEDSNCSGRDGEDLIIQLPVGTIIRNKNGEEIELTQADQEVIYLEGGRGGKGNTFFKTDVNQAPTHAQPGEEGKQAEVTLELKLLADVGIVGFPNAGKSTLISKISAARPKIADYPFTTLVPQLGVVKVTQESSFVIADIPGLIEGAHEGAGLGIKFLKHIEKTRCLLHLIDVSEMNIHNPLESFERINHELTAYDKKMEIVKPLSKRPQIIAFNKMDMVESDELVSYKRKFEKMGYKVFFISALSGFGVKELIFELKKLIDENNGEVES